VRRPPLSVSPITLRSTALSSIPLDEWSSRRREILHDNTQHSQQKDILIHGGIRTRSPNQRAATNPRLRPRGHWDRCSLISILNEHGPICRYFVSGQYFFSSLDRCEARWWCVMQGRAVYKYVCVLKTVLICEQYYITGWRTKCHTIDCARNTFLLL